MRPLLCRRGLALVGVVLSLLAPPSWAAVSGSCASNACNLSFSSSLNFGDLWAARTCPTGLFVDVPGKFRAPDLYVYGSTYRWIYDSKSPLAAGGSFCFMASRNGFSEYGWDAGWAMINGSPFSGAASPPLVSLVSPVTGAVYTAPATLFLSANASSPNSGGYITKVEFYNGASLLVTAVGSPYAYNWTGVGAGTYSLTAKAFDNLGATTTSPAASVTVTPGMVTASVGNVADGSFELPVLTGGTYVAASGPTIAGSPWTFAGANGSRGISTNFSPFTAQTVATTDGNQVAFIQGDGNVSQVVSFGAGKYQVSLKAIQRKENQDSTGVTLSILVDSSLWWSGVPNNVAYTTFTTPANLLAAGNHTIQVLGQNSVAGHDNTVFVDLVNVTQINVPPTVSLTVTPSTGLVAPASVTLNATASDIDGTIARVEFYGDGVLINTDTVSPYSFVWSGIAAGTRTASARAYDNAGASSTLSSQTFTVSASNAPPTVSLTVNPSSGLIAPGSMTLNATATDSDGTIARVEFYGDGVLINTDTTSPYSFLWSGLAAGTHTASAKAYDNLGASSALSSQTVTVSAAPANNVADGSFELPALAAGTYVAASGPIIAGSPWTFAGANGLRGISTNGSPFTAQTVATTNGNQVAFIQGDGNVSQVANFTTAGNYQVSLKAIQRKENQDLSGITLSILVDGIVRWSGVPNNVAYTTFTTPAMALTAGNHTIQVLGQNSVAGHDNTIFVDVVNVAAINVPPSVSLTVTPSTGLVAPASVTLTATATDSDGTIAKVEFYGDGVLINTDTVSPYSFVWSGLAAGSHTAMAKAYDNLGATTSASQTITVGTASVGNVADGSFELPSLAAGTYVAASGATIAGSPWTFAGANGSRGISTNGSLFTAQTVATTDGKQVAFIQGDGNVSQVVNLAGGNFQVSLKAIQRKENQDLSGITLSILVDGTLRWSGVPDSVAYSNFSTPTLALLAGNHTIQVAGQNSVAGHDNTIFIDMVNVGPPNLPPTVSLTVTPSTGLVAPATVTLSATASDSDGTITKVEFYGDGVLLNTDTVSPYSFVWGSLAAGTHTAMAKAYDNLGASTTATQTFTVSPPNVPPSVSLTVTPSTGLIAPASVTLTATATDTDGTIAKVEFYGDGVLINTDTTSPYSFVWNGLAAGTHTASAKAYDNLGLASALASQSITVSPTGATTDGSFELPVLATATYVAASGPIIAGSPWTFGGANGSRGISTNGSLFTAQTVATTNGNQVAFIQGDGNVSQVVNFATAGNYQVSLKAIQRKENQDLSGVTLSILVDGILRWSGVPDNVSYKTYATPTLALIAGNHTIQILGTNSVAGHDNTVFVDMVSAGPPNLLPTVSLTVTPSSGLVAPASVTLTATTSDSDGTITKVEFYGDGVLVNTDTVSPYSFVWSGLAAGTHNATAQAYDNLGATVSASQAITVNTDPNAIGDSDLVCTTPVSTSSVGATPGSFGVSDTGAATYAIPIQVPPGTAGMQPSLAIAFSSQGGDGHLGAGWGLSGLSTISRCPATEAQDGSRAPINYDANPADDAYCLDGQRLVPVAQSGNTVEYRTEIESYSRIMRYDDNVNVIGPGRWRVWTKSGQILDYGSRWWVISQGWFQRFFPANRVNSVKVWALDRAMDRAGNTMEIDYDGTNGAVVQSAAAPPSGFNALTPPTGAFPEVEFWPTAIRYYGVHGASVSDPGYNEVAFTYSDRSGVAPRDVLRFYDQGAGQTTTTKKLDSIRVTVDRSNFVAGTLTRTYNLAYAASTVSQRLLLQSVQECAGNGTCLAPTTFAWSGTFADVSWFQGTGSTSATTTINANSALNVHVADINGDGRSDLIRYAGQSGANNSWEVCLGPLTPGTCKTYTIDSYGDNGDITRWQVADTVGDGRAELLTYDNGTQTWKVCRFNGNGFDPCNLRSGPILYRTNSEWNEFFWGDFDGDGRIDIMSFHRGDSTTGFNYWDVCLSTGTAAGFSCMRDVPIPVNTQSGNLRNRALIADINGDGKADYLERATGNTGEDQWRVCLSDFDQSNPARQFNCGSGYIKGVRGDFERAVVLDLNGDGLADLVTRLDASEIPTAESCKVANDCWHVCIATGDGGYEYYDPQLHWTSSGLVDGNGQAVDPVTAPRCRYWSGLNAAFKDVIYGDFNGDGRTDMAAWDKNLRLFTVCHSTGAGFKCDAKSANFPMWPGGDAGNNADRVRTGDFNGDGKTDIAIQNSGTNWALGFSADTFADQLKSITTGLGATTTIAYAPITSSNVYAKGNPPVLSRELIIQSPLYVVQETRASNAIGGDFVTTYFYEGLKGRTDGRGIEGFFRRRTLDGNGNVTEVESLQVWPLSGRPMRMSKWAPKDGVRPDPAVVLRNSLLTNPIANMTLVNAATQTWTNRTYGIGSAYQGLTIANVAQPTAFARTIQQVHQIEARAQSFEYPAGTALPETVTTIPLAQIDVFGSIGFISVSTFDPAEGGTYLKETTNAYTNDSVNWILGRVTRADVRSVKATGETAFRASSWTYGSTQPTPSSPIDGVCWWGFVCTETIEPDYANDAANYGLWQETRYLYDRYGNRQSAIVTFKERDAANNLNVKTRSTTMSSVNGDAAGNNRGRFMLSVTNALGHTESRIYDNRYGSVAVVNGPNGLSTSTLFDGLGRRVCDAAFSGPTGTGHRLSQGEVLLQSCGSADPSYPGASACQAGESYRVRTKASGGGWGYAFFDNLQREKRGVTKAFLANDWAEIDTTYDALGRKASVTSPAGAGTITVRPGYDVLNRVTSELTTGTDGTSTRSTISSTVYNAMTTTVTRTNPTGGGSQVTSRTVNSQGLTTSTVDAAGKATTYLYDAFANLKQVTGPTGIVVGMTYDRRGRKVTMTDPDMGFDQALGTTRVWQYAYNGASELIWQRDAKNQETRVIYDGLGRMVERREYAGPETGVVIVGTLWTFDSCLIGKGKLCSTESHSGYPYTAANQTHKQTIVYDGAARPTSNTSMIGGASFISVTQYDNNGRVAQVTYPSGLVVKQSYTAWAGHLSKVTDSGGATTYWQATNRYHDGQITSMQVGPHTTTRTYDPFGRVKSVVTPGVQNANYAFDEVGNLTGRGDTIVGQPSETYGYDLVNRLTTTNGAAVAAYDAAGNITSRTGVGAYAYWAGTHRLKTVGGPNYNYDANGNLTDGGTRTVTLTPFNLPSRIAAGPAALDYVYDGSHARIQESSTTSGVTYFVGNQFYEEQYLNDGSTIRRHYISSPEGVVALVMQRSRPTLGNDTLTRYWHKDHLGSLASVTNESGTVVERFTYDVWGRRTTSYVGTGEPLEERGFTGHETLDDVAVAGIGLVHMNGRVYDPFTGRFMSADPVLQDPYNIQSYNRYSYVLNNPLSFTDPTGFSFWTKWRRPIIAIVAAIATYGAASAWMAAAALEAEGGSTFFAAVADFQYGATVATLTPAGTAAAGAAAGFAAGGIMGGNLESALYGAVAGGLSAGVAGYFGDTYSLSRVAAETVVGGINNRIEGGSFRDGLKNGFIFSATTYIAVSMREAMIEQSRLHPGNLGAASAGFRGLVAKLAGGRIIKDIYDAMAEDAYLYGAYGGTEEGIVEAYISAVDCSPLGCHQGGPGSFTIFGHTIPYQPGSLLDRIAEAYSGPHDYFNSPIWYNADGTARTYTGFAHTLAEGMNAANVLLVTPIVAISATPEYVRWIFNRQHR